MFMRDYPPYRDDLKSQVWEFSEWWEDYICSSPWNKKTKIQKYLSDATFYIFDGVKFVCCLIKGHDYGPANNAYGPREHCWFCYVDKPGTLIRRRFENDKIARHWPLKPKEIK